MTYFYMSSSIQELERMPSWRQALEVSGKYIYHTRDMARPLFTAEKNLVRQQKSNVSVEMMAAALALEGGDGFELHRLCYVVDNCLRSRLVLNPFTDFASVAWPEDDKDLPELPNSYRNAHAYLTDCLQGGMKPFPFEQYRDVPQLHRWPVVKHRFNQLESQ